MNRDRAGPALLAALKGFHALYEGDEDGTLDLPARLNFYEKITDSLGTVYEEVNDGLDCGYSSLPVPSGAGGCPEKVAA